MLRRVALTTCLVAVFTVTRAQTPTPRSVSDGVFTPAQADRGKPLYDEQCASCHGSMATIVPDMAPLLNDYVFRDSWNGRTLAEFFERIRDTMPQDKPGTLSPQALADLIAYILQANELPSGVAPLPGDIEPLQQIRFTN